MHNILIVEDESIIAIELKKILQNIGQSKIERLNTKSSALKYLQNNQADLVLLDINLEGKFEGIDIAKYLQVNHPNTSIIFITAYADTSILEAISEIKFSSYILKPFRREELEALFKIEILKLEQKRSTTLQLNNDYTFDTLKSILLFQKQEIKLTKNELHFIKLMSSSKQKIIPFETVEQEIWQDNNVSQNTRRNLIYKLNKKLPSTLIQTHTSLGYSIIK